MLVGDFNAQIGKKCFDDFLFQHELRSVNDKPFWYKNPDKPSCIDFILPNRPLSFFFIQKQLFIYWVVRLP